MWSWMKRQSKKKAQPDSLSVDEMQKLLDVLNSTMGTTDTVVAGIASGCRIPARSCGIGEMEKLADLLSPCVEGLCTVRLTLEEDVPRFGIRMPQ